MEQNFGSSGYAENEIYAFWEPKWPKDGPSYDNATIMFNIIIMTLFKCLNYLALTN